MKKLIPFCTTLTLSLALLLGSSQLLVRASTPCPKKACSSLPFCPVNINPFGTCTIGGQQYNVHQVIACGSITSCYDWGYLGP